MSSLPFDEKYLSYLLAMPHRKIRMVEVDGGFHLVIYTADKGTTHVLHAQRGHPRIFRSLDRALAMLKGKGVTLFSVHLHDDAIENGDGEEDDGTEDWASEIGELDWDDFEEEVEQDGQPTPKKPGTLRFEL